jgi:hypothetical protein
VPRSGQGTNEQYRALHLYSSRWIENWWPRWYEQSSATVPGYSACGTVILSAVSSVQYMYSVRATVFNPDHLFLIQRLSSQGTVLFIGALPTARYRIWDPVPRSGQGTPQQCREEIWCKCTFPSSAPLASCFTATHANSSPKLLINVYTVLVIIQSFTVKESRTCRPNLQYPGQSQGW